MGVTLASGEATAAAGPPRMTVVLLVDRERERGARCLASVLAQSIVDRLEVLLVDVAARGPRRSPGATIRECASCARRPRSP